MRIEKESDYIHIPKRASLRAYSLNKMGDIKDDPDCLAVGWGVVSAPHEETVCGQSVN